MKRFSVAACLFALLLAANLAAAQVPDVTTLGNAPGILNFSINANNGNTNIQTNQYAEPFVLKLAAPWMGYQYWMVVTPYVGGDADWENPSFAVSTDGVSWAQAPNVACPLATKPTGGVNSDPSMVFVNNQLMVYYNQTIGGYTNFVRLTYNGTTVSTPQLLTLNGNAFTLPNYPVSPAVIYEPTNQQYVMWYVSSNYLGCNDPAPVLMVCTSYNGVDWTGLTQCPPIPNQQGAIWHVSMAKDGATYKMLYCAYPTSGSMASCGFTDLYYAESADRVHWRSAVSPVLRSNHTQHCPWDNGEVYRSAFTVANGQFDIWYSGRHIVVNGDTNCSPNYGDNEWHLGHVTGCLYDCDAPSLFGSNATTYLSIPTYDGSNQLTNPDVAYVSSGWNGYKYWMAMTPYPNGNEAYSNPSVVASNDGLSWTVPTGLTNPLVAKPTGGFNNDPALVLVGSTMRMYFGQTFDSQHGANSNYHTDVRLMTSTNGTSWTSPQTVLTLANYVMSSTVIYDGSMYYLWYVTSPNGCPSSTQTMYVLQSSDGITWTGQTAVSIPNLPDVPFEMDVHQEGSTYRMLIAAYPSSTTCGWTSIYYAESSDRVHWTPRLDPMLRATAVGWDNTQVYRPTFTGSGSFLRIWYPARHTVVGLPGVDPMSQDQWQVGYTEVCLTGGDCLAPAAVTDLSPSWGKTTAVLAWTAPGDDGNSGTATEYDLRRSGSTINASNFSSATRITTSAPQVAGSAECASLTGLQAGHAYYFALKTADDYGNWSDLSNLPSGSTHSSGPEVICAFGGDRAVPAAEDVPQVMALGSPMPNPAGNWTLIRYEIPATASGSSYELGVFDVLGRQVQSLARGIATPGHFTASWSTMGSDGRRASAGVYYVRFRLGAESQLRTVTVLR